MRSPTCAVPQNYKAGDGIVGIGGGGKECSLRVIRCEEREMLSPTCAVPQNYRGGDSGKGGGGKE